MNETIKSLLLVCLNAMFVVSWFLLSAFILFGGIHIYRMGANGWLCFVIAAIVAVVSSIADTLGYIRLSDMIERL